MPTRTAAGRALGVAAEALPPRGRAESALMGVLSKGEWFSLSRKGQAEQRKQGPQREEVMQEIHTQASLPQRHQGAARAWLGRTALTAGEQTLIRGPAK